MSGLSEIPDYPIRAAFMFAVVLGSQGIRTPQKKLEQFWATS